MPRHVDLPSARKRSGRTCATRCPHAAQVARLHHRRRLALAIGIGGNTAIFSLVDAMRARALPYQDPDRLVELWGNVQRATVERRGTSYPDYLDWRAQSKSFDDMAAFDCADG